MCGARGAGHVSASAGQDFNKARVVHRSVGQDHVASLIKMMV